MHPSLKNVTERAQKCDFSVNFHILIEQTGFRSDLLCQKVDITCHCVFVAFPSNLKMHPSLKNVTERAHIAYNKSKAST